MFIFHLFDEINIFSINVLFDASKRAAKDSLGLDIFAHMIMIKTITNNKLDTEQYSWIGDNSHKKNIHVKQL